MRAIICIFVLSIFLSDCSEYPDITPQDIENLRIDIRQAIDDSTTGPCGPPFITCDEQPLIGSMVRLVFHDCAARNFIQNYDSSSSDAPSSDSSSFDFFSTTDSSSSDSSSSDSSSSSSSSTDSSSSESSSEESTFETLTDNICNGCFDFTDPQNAGLEETAFEPLEDVYHLSDNQWYNKMSRADFWIASAQIGLEYAAENQFTKQLGPLAQFIPPAPLPDMSFYFGRKDCSQSGEADESAFTFPDPKAGWNETKQWFFDNLWDNITVKEIVALMGGHSVGKAHAAASGHISRWTTNINVLNAEYYLNLGTAVNVGPAIVNTMAFGGFEQRRVGDLDLCNNVSPINLTCDSTFDNLQWVIGPTTLCCPNITGIILQLNTDISLALEIEPHLNRNTGEVSCTAPSPAFPGLPPPPNPCGFQTETAPFVNQYAGDNALWLRDFADVWQKLTLNGYMDQIDQLQNLTVNYSRAVEAAYQPPGGPPFSALSDGEQQDNGQHSIVSEDGDHEPSKFNHQYYYYGAFVVFCIMICIIGLIYRYRYFKQRSNESIKQIEECDHSDNDSPIVQLEVTEQIIEGQSMPSIDITTTQD